MARYQHIPEWQDIDRYRGILCKAVNSDELSTDKAIERFEKARAQKIQQLRQRLERQAPDGPDRPSRSDIG